MHLQARIQRFQRFQRAYSIESADTDSSGISVSFILYPGIRKNSLQHQALLILYQVGVEPTQVGLSVMSSSNPRCPVLTDPNLCTFGEDRTPRNTVATVGRKDTTGPSIDGCV